MNYQPIASCAKLLFNNAIIRWDPTQDSVAFEVRWDTDTDTASIVATVHRHGGRPAQLVVTQWRTVRSPYWSFHWDVTDIQSDMDADSIDARDQEPVLDAVRTIQKYIKGQYQ